MPIPQRRHPAATLGAMLAVLAGSIALAAYVTAKHNRHSRAALAESTHLGDVDIAFPDGWTALPTDWRYDLAAVEAPAGHAGDAETPAGRRMTLSLELPREGLPLESYAASRFGEGRQGHMVITPMQLAGHPAQLCELHTAPGDEGALSDGAGFRWICVAALPSGRILALRLDGEGEPPGPHEKAQFLACCESITIDGEERPAADDPLARLRYVTLRPPLATLATGHGVPAHRLTLASGHSTIAVSIYPVYLPALSPSAIPPPSTRQSTPPAFPPASPAPRPPPSDDYPTEAEALARQLVALHDPSLLSAPHKWQSPTRLMFAGPPMRDGITRAMAVWDGESGKSGAIIIARGGAGTDGQVNLIVNRTADALTFSRTPTPSAEPTTSATAPGTLAVAGIQLASAIAQRPPQPPTPELALLWKRDNHLIGWTACTPDGTVTSHRLPARGEDATMATLHVEPGRGHTLSLIQAQWIMQGDIPTATGVPTQAQLPNPATLPPISPDDLRTVADTFTFGGPASYIPGAKLLQSLPLAGHDPALFATDAVPWIQLDARPAVWFVLASPIRANTSPSAPPDDAIPIPPVAWDLHILGSDITLRCHYAPDHTLTSIENLTTGESATAFHTLAALQAQLPHAGPLAW